MDYDLVIPYFEPKATMNGLNLRNYTNKGDFSNMTLDAYKKIDFKENGMAPKTNELDGTATGYIVYYLTPNQKLDCTIGLTFENAGVDYTDDDHDIFTINFVNSAFNSSTKVKVSYD